MALIDALLDPWTLAIIALGIVGAAIIIIVLRRGDGGNVSLPGNGGGGRGKKSIDVLRPRDKRAFTMPISAETEIALQCPKKDNVHWRFYKSGPGWTFPNGAVKFHGIEGTAYTAVIRNDQNVTLKLANALRILWGDDAYDKTPKALKEIIEKHQFGVTIYPEKIPDADKQGGLSAIDIDSENDAKVIEHIAKAVEGKKKMDWMTFLQGGAVFAFVVLLLCLFHVIPIPGK